MNKRLIVKQNGKRDCASACLLSIMRYYGVNVSHEEVTFSIKTSYEGTNALNIINGSRTFGFDGYGYHYTYDEIINNKINFPIICHVKKFNMYHFIVVYSCNKKYLEIMDPSSNITKIKKEEFKDIYQNTSIVIFKNKEIKQIEKNKNLFYLIFDYLKQEKKYTIKVILLSILVILLSTISNYYLYIIIDKVLTNYNNLYFICLTIIFTNIYIFKNIFSYIRQKNLIQVEKNLFNKINIDIIRKFFYLPYQFFKNKSSSEIVSRINDLKEFKSLFSNIIVTSSIDIIFLIISSIILININYKVFLINIVEIFIYYLIMILYKKSYIYKSEDVLISNTDYNKCLLDSINSYNINKNLNMIKIILKNLEIKYLSFSNKIKEYEKNINKERFLKELLCDLFYICTLFLLVISVFNGQMTSSEIILYNSILFYFIEPAKNIIDLNKNIIYLKIIYNRINDLILVKSEQIDNKTFDIKGNIIINNLSYSINNYNYLFSNVNFNINYGSKFLIYGDSGNGKSTIIKILLKYLNEYKGEIKINNINLKDINQNTILNNITYVSQNNYVINDTLKNNIIYFRNISDQKYEEVLNICNLNALRDSKQNRNNFLIEDNGFNISGGEKQKIILARSLLKDFNYLILDEALSEVGFDEEKEILNKIFKFAHDKTIIYISHKKEIIELFNEKFKLERRKVYDE